MKVRLKQKLLVVLWCGWVIVQQPQLFGKDGMKPDASKPIHEWDVATFGGVINFFDTAQECKQNSQKLAARLSTCIPGDWIKPRRWWQLWN